MSGVRPRAAWMVGVLGLCVSTLGVVNRAGAGGLLQPSSFASLGQLPDESGTYSINTNGSTPIMTLPDGTTINGILDPSGQIAVFTFNSVQLDGSTMIAQGSRPVALLSLGNIALSSVNINLNASAPNSWSPQTIPGAGGDSLIGPGNGGQNFATGGGAGHGGAGGAAGPGIFNPAGPDYNPGSFPGAPGGSAYGGLSAPFLGGSFGGSALYGSLHGGAGGGAIELGAVGSLSAYQSSITANGGNGDLAAGGGSGGSVSLLAQNVNLQLTLLSAAGGNGGDEATAGGPGGFDLGPGGGGAGGIIQFQGSRVENFGYVNVNGGTGYQNGGAGVFANDPSPEPSSIVIGSIALLAVLGYSLIRRRRTTLSK